MIKLYTKSYLYKSMYFYYASSIICVIIPFVTKVIVGIAQHNESLCSSFYCKLRYVVNKSGVCVCVCFNTGCWWATVCFCLRQLGKEYD